MAKRIVVEAEGLQLEVIVREPSELDETRTHEVELPKKLAAALSKAIKACLKKTERTDNAE